VTSVPEKVELMTGAIQVSKYIRVSVGSAIVLGLMKAKLDAPPTTVYLMTYRKEKCDANCSFCPQARGSGSKSDMLSRVSWPIFLTGRVVDEIGTAFRKREIKRVCIQALNYPEVFNHVFALVEAIYSSTRMPISVSCQPARREEMVELARAGVQRIGIPLDAATEEIFNKIKGTEAGGPYNWRRQLQLLKDACKIFGKGMVSTHLIVGIGETEEQMIKAIQKCIDMSVLPGLFAFTPVAGTVLAKREPPDIQRYRRIQIARYLMLKKMVRSDDMEFDENGLTNYGVNEQTLDCAVRTGRPFLTSGCPDCNRPYYNERPGGTIYNYPKKLTENEILHVQSELIVDRKQAKDGTN
jgi:lipoyl synthase